MEIMQRLTGFSQSPPAVTSATSSLAFIPMNQNVKFSEITTLKTPQAQCRASSEVQDTFLRSTKSGNGISQIVVGFLGGGQLGRMLCQAASCLAIKVIILDRTENCPASTLCHHHMVGSYDDGATFEEFAKRCGVLTIEIEHVDVALATLEKLEQQGVDCQPKASTIRKIKIDDIEGAKRAGEQFGYPLMIKSRRGESCS